MSELQQGEGRVVETRGPPILRESFGQVMGNLRPEVVQMRLDSVVALVGGADDHRQHFSLCP